MPRPKPRYRCLAHTEGHQSETCLHIRCLEHHHLRLRTPIVSEGVTFSEYILQYMQNTFMRIYYPDPRYRYKMMRQEWARQK